MPKPLKTNIVRLAFLLICFFHFALEARAADVSILSSENTNLRPDAVYLRDPTGELGIEGARAAYSQGKFEDLGSKKGLGYTHDTVWLRFEIENKGTKTAQLLLEIAYAPTNYVNFFIFENGILAAEHATGQALTQSAKFRSYENPHLPFDLNGGVKAEVFIRINTSTSLNVTALVWEREHALEGSLNKRFWLGLFYGGIIALILYNLFLAATTRDRMYWVYVCYLVSLVIFYGGWNGLGNVLLWNGNSVLSTAGIPIGWSFMVVAVSEFSIVFLGLTNYAPRRVKVMRFVESISAVLFFLAIAMPKHIWNPYLVVLTLIQISFMIYSGVSLARKGVRQARFYIAGWTILLLAGTFASLSISGILPMQSYTPYVPQMAGLLEAIVFSVGLGDKINTERRGRLMAQKETIQSLERIVRISGGIAHELNNPLGIILLSANKINTIATRQITDAAISKNIVGAHKNICSALDRVAFVVRAVGMISGELNFPVEMATVRKIADGAVEKLQLGGEDKVTIEIDPNLQWMVQVPMLEEALFQLLKNASDATQVAGVKAAIRVLARVENGVLVIAVEDNGNGIKPGDEERVFEPFVTTKAIGSGFGLGLNIIKGVSEQHGGSFTIARVHNVTVATLVLSGAKAA